MGQIMQPVRVAVTGTAICLRLCLSPSDLLGVEKGN